MGILFIPYKSRAALPGNDCANGCIQRTGAYVEQTLTGLEFGAAYIVSFLAANRPGVQQVGGDDDEALVVSIDGLPIWETDHPADAFAEYRGVFVAASASATLRFENDSPDGDKSVRDSRRDI